MDYVYFIVTFYYLRVVILAFITIDVLIIVVMANSIISIVDFKHSLVSFYGLYYYSIRDLVTVSVHHLRRTLRTEDHVMIVFNRLVVYVLCYHGLDCGLR